MTIGDGAIVGAGSVITEDVEADSLAVERSEQKGIAGWAKRFRERMTPEGRGVTMCGIVGIVGKSDGRAAAVRRAQAARISRL